MYRDLLTARTQEFVEEVLEPHFGGLIAFVKDAEMMMDRSLASQLQYEESEIEFWSFYNW